MRSHCEMGQKTRRSNASGNSCPANYVMILNCLFPLFCDSQRSVTVRWYRIFCHRPSEAPHTCPAATGQDLLSWTGEKVSPIMFFLLNKCAWWRLTDRCWSVCLVCIFSWAAFRSQPVRRNLPALCGREQEVVRNNKGRIVNKTSSTSC